MEYIKIVCYSTCSPYLNILRIANKHISKVGQPNPNQTVIQMQIQEIGQAASKAGYH